MSRRGDGLSAAGWAAFGTWLLVASWRMDRLQSQGVAPWSAPGIAPAVVGALIVVFALALAAQAWRTPADEAEPTGAPMAPGGQPGSGLGPGQRTAVAALLCLAFAGFSLGRGLPFVFEAGAFILVFTAIFRWSEWRARQRIARGLAITALIAAGAALGIAWLFESVFLVRLP